MTPGEIKKLLLVWRPGASAPANIEQAREEAAKDPELSHWLEQERSFDIAFANKLREVKPPEELVEQILRAASADKVVEFERRIARHQPRHGWLRGTLIGAAALFAVAAGLFSFLQPREPAPFDMAGFVSATMRQAMREPVAPGTGFEQVRERLLHEQAPLPDSLPIQFRMMDAVGCRAFKHQGSTMSLIVLRGDNTCQLIVAERSNIGPICKRYERRPIVYDLGDEFAVTWADGSRFYILVTSRQGENLVRQIQDI